MNLGVPPPLLIRTCTNLLMSTLILSPLSLFTFALHISFNTCIKFYRLEEQIQITSPVLRILQDGYHVVRHIGFCSCDLLSIWLLILLIPRRRRRMGVEEQLVHFISHCLVTHSHSQLYLSSSIFTYWFIVSLSLPSYHCFCITAFFSICTHQFFFKFNISLLLMYVAHYIYHTHSHI